MKNTDILSRITALLNKKVSLAQNKLDNGTVVEADSFAVGDPIFAIDGDNKIPLGVGEYTMEDGSKLEVKEIGIIAEVEAVEVEEVETKEEEKEEMSTEIAEELKEDDKEEDKEKMSELKLEEIVEAVMQALQPKFDEMELKYKEMGKGQNEIKETLSSSVAKKPLIHKPAMNEAVSSTNKRNNISGTESRIMAMLSK